MNTREEFKAKEARLAVVCELLASATETESKKTATELRRMVGAFSSDVSAKEKSEAAADLRRLRRELEEGFHPAEVSRSDWQETVDEAYDLSTIYIESRYSDARLENT